MRRTLYLGALSALNIGGAFFYQYCALSLLGPGVESDALFAGMTLPQLALAVISSSLMHAIVPLLAGEGRESAQRDAWTLFIAVGGALSLIAVLLALTAPLWVPLTVPGFNHDGVNLTVALTRIQLGAMIFAGVNGVQLAAYHARQEFIWAELATLICTCISILLLIWSLPIYGVTSAALIGVLRAFLQTVLLLPGMGRAPVKLHLPAVYRTWSRVQPLILGTSYYKTDPMIDRIMLSQSTAGTLTIYFLAQQIYSAGNQVFNKALAAPLVPQLSTFHKQKRLSDFHKAFKVTFMSAIGMAIFCALFLAIAGKELLTIVFGHGRIVDSDVSLLAKYLIWLIGVFIGEVAGQVTSSALYALGDTKTPTRIGMATYTIYVPAKIWAFYGYGVAGLALSTSAFVLVNMALQLFVLKQKMAAKITDSE